MVERQDWFQLRRALRDREATDFYRGVAAAAFQQTNAAEMHLGRTIAAGSQSSADAHGRLAYMYMRAGRYRKTYQHLSAMHRLQPDFPGLPTVLPLFSALKSRPELRVARRQPSEIQMTRDFFIPVSVNGEQRAYGFDTGANLSLMSESEATRLHLRVHEAAGSEYRDDASGNAVPIRFVVVDRLQLGGFELRHVVFMLAAAGAMPFRELPPDKQAILGLPPLLALGTVGWNGARVLRIGYHTAPNSASPNLCFDEGTPVVEAWYAGQPVSGWLDTGNGKTYLTQRFVRDFPAAMTDKATRRRHVLRGVGGETEVELLQLPETRLTIGQSDLVLRPADILPHQQNVDRNAYHIWLGMDVLGDREVLIDFRSMTVTVGPAASRPSP